MDTGWLKANVAQSFNPSWESRPSGTVSKKFVASLARFVSTPHGRAVPLEPPQGCEAVDITVVFQPLMGEPSLWNGDTHFDLDSRTDRFQPLMGEPSLWNDTVWVGMTLLDEFQPLMGEPSLWNPPLKPKSMFALQMFQPLMGEPSLWNWHNYGWWPPQSCRFNPSWESRPSGTE